MFYPELNVIFNARVEKRAGTQHLREFLCLCMQIKSISLSVKTCQGCHQVLVRN